MSDHFHRVVEALNANRVAGMKWMLGTCISPFNRSLSAQEVHNDLFVDRRQVENGIGKRCQKKLAKTVEFLMI